MHSFKFSILYTPTTNKNKLNKNHFFISIKQSIFFSFRRYFLISKAGWADRKSCWIFDEWKSVAQLFVQLPSIERLMCTITLCDREEFIVPKTHMPLVHVIHLGSSSAHPILDVNIGVRTESSIRCVACVNISNNIEVMFILCIRIHKRPIREHVVVHNLSTQSNVNVQKQLANAFYRRCVDGKCWIKMEMLVIAYCVVQRYSHWY